MFNEIGSVVFCRVSGWFNGMDGGMVGMVICGSECRVGGASVGRIVGGMSVGRVDGRIFGGVA